jgi:hypothetical protein
MTPSLGRLHAAALAATLLAGCSSVRYDPERATRPYPAGLHQADTTLDLHVFRDGESIQIQNSSPRSFENVSVWINQRYVLNDVTLPAGAQSEFQLEDFRDVRGEGLHPGGLLRRFEPTPVRLVEIQVSETEPLIGLIAIRAEPAE